MIDTYIKLLRTASRNPQLVSLFSIIGQRLFYSDVLCAFNIQFHFLNQVVFSIRHGPSSDSTYYRRYCSQHLDFCRCSYLGWRTYHVRGYFFKGLPRNWRRRQTLEARAPRRKRKTQGTAQGTARGPPPPAPPPASSDPEDGVTRTSSSDGEPASSKGDHPDHVVTSNPEVKSSPSENPTSESKKPSGISHHIATFSKFANQASAALNAQ